MTAPGRGQTSHAGDASTSPRLSRKRRSPSQADEHSTDARIAYRRLRELILHTELAPGISLNEHQLIARLGVGRTPLRDALHLLAHEGLVEILPRRGTFVTEVTVSDLQQIFEVRSGIEDIVAHAAAARANPPYLRQLDALIARAQKNPSQESDVDVDEEFHSLMLEVASNRYLSEMYQRLADASLRLLYLTGCGMEPTDEQVTFFRQAREALAKSDGAALSEILREHVRAFRDRVSGSLFVGGRGWPSD